MDLKVTEGIIRTTQYRFIKKKFKKYRLRFSAKNQKFHKAIVGLWRKKRAETATSSDVEILA